MSELVQMRQRIKAIETIKKITHAMRLIAMSSHAQLKHKKNALSAYTDEVSAAFERVRHAWPQWKNPVFYPPHSATQELIILIGSQKGLCGSFNAALFQFFNARAKNANARIIGVGKRAVDFLQEQHSHELIGSYEMFSARNYDDIARELTDRILYASPHFKSVIVFGNTPRTFFLQEPHAHTIIPFKHLSHKTTESSFDYNWKQEPSQLINALAQQYLEAKIRNLLFQSLLAEQSARFISMDSATRNANTLLDTSRLYYNKLRQAKITKEITELSGSFS